MGPTRPLTYRFHDPEPRIPCSQPQASDCPASSAPNHVLSPTYSGGSSAATEPGSSVSVAIGAGQRSGAVSRYFDHECRDLPDEKPLPSGRSMTGSPVAAAGSRVLSAFRRPAHVPDQSQPIHVSREPIHPLYLEAQMIFDGLAYFNECVSGDLISVKSHFNPYRIQTERLEPTPRIYVNMLVSIATLHRSLLEEANDQIADVTSAVGRHREQEIFRFRIRALQELNYRLSKKETQRNNITLKCVICLLVATFQQSAYGDWRTHLEGARAIIKIRGGIKQLAAEYKQFRPLVAMFIVADVMSATTTSTQHPRMAEATSMALHYWEAAPNMFSANLAISSPCPEDLFQSIILTSYLRTTVKRADFTPRRQAGTRMVIDKIRAFNVPQWAAKMKGFKGWSQTGETVEFEDEDTTPVTMSPSSSESSSPWDSPQENYARSATETSPPIRTLSSLPNQEPDLWLRVGLMYRCAVMLYTIRTLLLDVDEDKSFLLSDSTSAASWRAQDATGLLEEIRVLHREVHRTLFDALVPVFSDRDMAREVGKLVYFPAFMCAMEMSEVQALGVAAEMARKEFVAKGLELLGQACGTMAPICAAEEARRKWDLDTREGKTVNWDEFFTGRPDFTVGY